MKFHILFPVFLLLAAVCSGQQTRPVRMKTATGPVGEFRLDAVTTAPGVFSAMVRFAGQDTVYCDTVSVSRRFLELPAPNPGRPWVEATLGNAWGAVDTSVMYRLPYGLGREAVYSPVIEAGGPTHLFRLAQGDTVYAARRGVVLSVKKTENRPNLRGEEILVQHGDGSWALYMGLAAGSAAVTPGQTVWPDTPIALAGRNPKYGYAVVLALRFPVVEKDRRGRFTQIDLNPSFAIATSEPLSGKGIRYRWTPALTYDMLIQEMTPEDARRLGPGVE